MRLIATLLAVNSKDGKFPPLDDMKILFAVNRPGENTAAQRNAADPKFVPPPPGCPRPIKDQKDLDRVRAAMIMGQASGIHTSRGVSDPSGAAPHPKARKAKYGITE
jgi:hypothetical protein